MIDKKTMPPKASPKSNRMVTKSTNLVIRIPIHQIRAVEQKKRANRLKVE
jgi:hypothetical protein